MGENPLLPFLCFAELTLLGSPSRLPHPQLRRRYPQTPSSSSAVRPPKAQGFGETANPRAWTSSTAVVSPLGPSGPMPTGTHWSPQSSACHQGSEASSIIRKHLTKHSALPAGDSPPSGLEVTVVSVATLLSLGDAQAQGTREVRLGGCSQTPRVQGPSASASWAREGGLPGLLCLPSSHSSGEDGPVSGSPSPCTLWVPGQDSPCARQSPSA